MFKIIVLFATVLPTLITSEPKLLFTNPSKVDSDVLNVERSLEQVKGLLSQLDSNQFSDLSNLVNQIQGGLKTAKRQFDVDNDFDKLAQRVQSLKEQLNAFAPKLKNDLESMSRKH